jgi:Fe-S-cluster containining protein
MPEPFSRLPLFKERHLDLPALEQILTSSRIQPFLERIEDLYADMDRRYETVAAQHGFICRGCEQSCCRTCFYHYTYAEYFYLRHGLKQLSSHQLADVKGAAQRIVTTPMYAEGEDPVSGAMCPLNVDGRCILYSHRPMICRLHGISHIMRRPDGGWVSGPGCAVFEAGALKNKEIRLDRTPIYQQMAELETCLRRALELSGKIRLTIAEMLI